ncbi:probable thiopurine S-methyltransferase [Gigantopelta aegis]|uniref:probable thiopurine S-methyltransferase n=1 Tax=Gigantopelta aegis TaxID=1735272 RepID=UPI001B88BB65|nr:probable thiopurine S-methyltransferase [Gigantopelta aegis]XP_041359431.1 probable thiopurine S-methyltransferase [Gigantopelta aegis]XP_041359432.1 probable thiopurine S-methyltransferase [Gigantopelta aegis]XP_041359433.1 probable thiopurine S-methyltransferase [Gigantopelta aegis]XP_041359435.1 probable thiopurine S-methyltransferase [Gigantopelta aegis]
MAGDKKRLNQFGDYEDTAHMSVDDWKYRWDKQQTQFHMPIIHPMLQKHLETLAQGRSKLRFFVPLCGKSLDLKWLLEQGHEVIGCEGVDKGCQEFFQEHKMQYTTCPMKSCEGTVYQAKCCPLTIYRCDFFELKSDDVGQFDCIWDRGSFVAIPVTDRKRYVDVIVPLMKSDCRYLLDCFLVNNDQFGGPPFNCTDKDVSTFYGSYCTVKKIDEKDAFTEWQKSWGISYFVEEIYMIELK